MSRGGGPATRFPPGGVERRPRGRGSGNWPPSGARRDRTAQVRANRRAHGDAVVGAPDPHRPRLASLSPSRPVERSRSEPASIVRPAARRAARRQRTRPAGPSADAFRRKGDVTNAHTGRDGRPRRAHPSNAVVHTDKNRRRPAVESFIAKRLQCTRVVHARIDGQRASRIAASGAGQQTKTRSACLSVNGSVRPGRLAPTTPGGGERAGDCGRHNPTCRFRHERRRSPVGDAFIAAVSPPTCWP